MKVSIQLPINQIKIHSIGQRKKSKSTDSFCFFKWTGTTVKLKGRDNHEGRFTKKKNIKQLIYSV